MKYELLIKDILKHTKRAGLIEEAEELERALNIMRVGFAPHLRINMALIV